MWALQTALPARGSAQPPPPIHVVRGVVTPKPPPEGRQGVRLARRGDPLGVRGIAREFEEHAVGVSDIQRAAVAVLQHKGVRCRIARRLDAPRDRRLRRLIDLERDVMKGCLRMGGLNVCSSVWSANWKNARAPPSARPKKQWQYVRTFPNSSSASLQVATSGSPITSS